MSRLPQLLKLRDADPTDADVPYMIALEHAKSGSGDEALSWLDQAIATDADHFYAYFQKALLLQSAGRIEEAKSAADTGIARAEAGMDPKAAGELRDLRERID